MNDVKVTCNAKDNNNCLKIPQISTNSYFKFHFSVTKAVKNSVSIFLKDTILEKKRNVQRGADDCAQ